jgi:hypothetical protein
LYTSGSLVFDAYISPEELGPLPRALYRGVGGEQAEGICADISAALRGR